MRFKDGQFEIVTLGFKTNVEPYRVERVVGADPVRQFLTASSGGRWQVQELSYDPQHKNWFDVYGSEDRQPGEYGHWTGRGMNWNSECADCHNTGVRKNYEAATDSYHTTIAEMSVGCEACHGPLKNHTDWQKAHPKSPAKDPTISPMSISETLSICGFCHSRRDDLTGRFKPGDSYFDHYSLEILGDTRRWYPDGQIKDEDYEFASFLSSKMYERGVSCVDCHNVHSMKPLFAGNDLCLRCHGGGNTNAPVINPVEHGHHQPGSKGNECVGCHMPSTVYMQRQLRHDHGFTIPDPLLTKELQIPNACDRCHADKNRDWELSNTQKWYGDKMNRHTRERAEWIAAAEAVQDNGRDRLVEMLAGKTESSYWRAVAANFLYPWATQDKVKAALLAGLKNPSRMVREQSARSLEPLVQVGDSETTAALTPLLKDENRTVRVACAWVLRASVDLQSGAGQELQTALDLQADQPRGQYQEALLLLARQRPADAVEHLKTAVAWDPFSPTLRLAAATVLRQLGRDGEADEMQATAPRQPGSH